MSMTMPTNELVKRVHTLSPQAWYIYSYLQLRTRPLSLKVIDTVLGDSLQCGIDDVRFLVDKLESLCMVVWVDTEQHIFNPTNYLKDDKGNYQVAFSFFNPETEVSNWYNIKDYITDPDFKSWVEARVNDIYLSDPLYWATGDTAKIEPSPRMPKPGYVYLIKAATELPRYKIGLSTKPDERLETIRMSLQFDLKVELLHTIKTNDMYRLESELHTHYASKNVGGEWFELTNRDVRTICKMKETNYEVQS